MKSRGVGEKTAVVRFISASINASNMLRLELVVSSINRVYLIYMSLPLFEMLNISLILKKGYV
jgi:hypothetical protein